MTTTPITGDTWGDEIEQPRAFILKEAQRPFAELTQVFASAHAGLVSELAGVSETQASFKPGSGEGEDAYCIREVVRHMVHAHPLMELRIRVLATGAEPPAIVTSPGNRGGNEDATLAQLTLLLDAATASLLATVAEVEGSERLDTTLPHRLFGELNCRGWLAMQALHVEDHTRQVRKIKAQPGYPRP